MAPSSTGLYLSEVRRIAVFRALQLGDVLCMIPAARALRNAFPRAFISFIGLQGTRELVERYPQYFDQFILFPGHPGLPEQEFNPSSYRKFTEEMRNRNFDLILQMQGNGSIVNDMLRELHPRQLAGFCQTEAEQNALMLKYPAYGHEIHRHLALMDHLGIRSAGTVLEFPLLPRDVTELNQTGFAFPEDSYVCVHPGSRGSWRQWAPEYFAAVSDRCAERGYAVVITGTAGEMPLALEVAAHMKHQPTIVTGRTNLGTMAALLSKARMLLANCTGVSHLAAALETPSVVISMDGEPERWGPLNKKLHRTIDWTRSPDKELVLKEVLSLL